MAPEKRHIERLWNLNFFLLWQGQLVSAFGDTVYDIALGFWVLAETGSTGLMGILMAAAVIPRVFISPFAGTFVDRHDRKKILIIADLIRGIAITLVGVAASSGVLEPWMVLGAGLIMGCCACFFNPSVSATIPDIVSESKLLKANSTFSIVQTATGILGNSIGGFLFQLLGAPVMFLINGLSYLFSAVTEFFIQIPKVIHEGEQINFWEDLKAGMRYVANFTELKLLYITIGILNFFALMGLILVLPLFNLVEGFGPEMYGVAMGFSAGGMFLGFLSMSTINFRCKKSTLFILTGNLSALIMIFIPFITYFPLIALVFLINGYCVALLNSLIQTSMQQIVPKEMRGKVFGFRRTITSSLTPLAMALGGILAEVISIRVVMATSFILLLLLFLRVSFHPAIGTIFNHEDSVV